MSDPVYLPISLSTLVPESNVGIDLYQPAESSAESGFILFRGRDFPIGSGEIERLRERGIRQLYISQESQGQYQQYLRELAESGFGDSSLTARVGALNDVVRTVLETSFAADDSDATVSAVAKLGAMTTEVITHDEFAASDLFRVMNHDYTTFTHVTNVAFYCAILGRELGMESEELQQLTIGGLLHDLGKLEVADGILCKPGRLDETEFRVIKMHPTTGFRRLAHREDLSRGQLMMVYQHHERIDGQGYPVGVTGDQIHPWAKICAVVDVFEALTSHRPYRTPMPRRRVLELQSRDSGTAFDPEVLRCWSSIIQRDFVS